LYDHTLKEIRIEKIKLDIQLRFLEDRIVTGIINGASPDLLEQSKKVWREGYVFLRKNGWKI